MSVMRVGSKTFASITINSFTSVRTEAPAIGIPAFDRAINDTFKIQMSDIHQQQQQQQQPNIHQKMLQRSLGAHPQLQHNFASPTDNMMSPCSKKLNDHKNRFIAQYVQFVYMALIGSSKLVSY